MSPTEPAPADVGPPRPFAEVRSLKRELLAELRASWEQGEPERPEELLPRWPGDPESDADVAGLLLEDYLQRAGRGEAPAAEEYEQRFPGHGSSLASLIHHQDFLRSMGCSGGSAPRLRLPDVGDEVFGFRLKRELGRGAFARVYLAEQADLAGRPVVLKVSAIEGDEPQALAQLQHTHIVPIHSVHEDGRAGLRAVCMPYFGGASLSQVLQHLWTTTFRPATGGQLVQALSEAGGPAPAGPGGAAPALRGLDYVRASVWIVARLAEGLQHAHQRGVLHRDIKPSNVLLTADGQPMLLDFNLAAPLTLPSPPSEGGEGRVRGAGAAALGGTVAYMAPEHLRAVARQDVGPAAAVDGRADVYSLGMVLFEMLTGARPFEQGASYTPLPMLVEAMAVERSVGAPSPRQARPDLPWGLESVVRKCLDPDPARRYQQPGDLADDLNRFLDDRPLRHAPEPSAVERMQKWARRHPRLRTAAAVAGAAAVLLALAGVALVATRDRLSDVSGRLSEKQARERLRDHEAKALRALLLVNTTSDRLYEHLPQGRQACEEALGLYDTLNGRRLEEHPDWARLDGGERRRLAERTQELLLLLAGARARLVPAPAGLRQALALLDLAESLPGLPPSRAISEDRAAYLGGLGEAAAARTARDRAGQIEPASARDFYLLAMASARAGRYAEAVAQLDKALRREPKHYGAWVQRGICHQERGEHALAAGDFGVCVGLWPDFAWGHFNRACAADACGHREEAVRGFTEALRLDPDFVLARLDRGLARLEQEQYRAALEDLDAAARLGCDDAGLHGGRGVALERLGRHADAGRAFRLAERRAAALPRPQRLRLRWAYGFAVAARLPDRARAAFDEVLREDPVNAQALYGRGMLAQHQGEAEAALSYFSRAAEASPGYVEPRRFRAVLLARLGRKAEAARDINWCLAQKRGCGATLYAAACVSALLAEREREGGPADDLAGQALAFLRKAFDSGYGRDRAAGDDDLAGLRPRREFGRLLAGGR